MRVVRPARAPRFGGLYEGRLGAQFCLDKRTATMFALAWGFAARSPYTLVHLPMRAAAAPPACSWGRSLDLLLLHHRLAFPPSRWKQVRARLGPGRPHTVTLPGAAWPARPAADHRRAWHRDFRDQLRWDIAADTLTVTGSRRAFDLVADQVRALAEECPAHRADAADALLRGDRHGPAPGPPERAPPLRGTARRILPLTRTPAR
ncbi:hypothetical protein OOK41_15845 [Micromonospora sp. NBC_01655]|uniref:hypothetical protein n=1 Tax=Micromonospora sp. NBC_01655 TaxID=2975983 RepID=UPI0022576C9D|nr:hypothetical protein [Micromonospora sp. NBC_01655]MCX4471760.1 hypothetical protein [Micromonospora sp. NBC_01655]